MSEAAGSKRIAILGGTGALGTGLVRRWTQAGHAVIIGSRTLEKAEAALAELKQVMAEWGATQLDVAAMENLDAARAGKGPGFIEALRQLARRGPFEREPQRERRCLASEVLQQPTTTPEPQHLRAQGLRRAPVHGRRAPFSAW